MIVVYYAEIALKGKNKSWYENRLVFNIKRKFEKYNEKVDIKTRDSRLFLETDITNEKATEYLKKIFGISHFVFPAIIETSKKNLLKEAKKQLSKLKGTVAIQTKRNWKQFELTSPEIGKEVGEIGSQLGLKFDYSNPENTLYIDVMKKQTILYSEKIRGLGGLPVGSTGKVLCLFSGGIDSCAAAWLMMKRGCSVDFIHFHAFPKNEMVKGTKIYELFEILNEYQYRSRLHLSPYHHFDLEVQDNVVFFRNFMLQVAQKIAKWTKCKALVTGDALAQVASQTLENLSAVEYNITYPIFRPLLCFDKIEIIKLAKDIGTFDISIKEYKDCCSMMSKVETRIKYDKFIESIKDVKFPIDETLKETKYFK